MHVHYILISPAVHCQSLSVVRRAIERSLCHDVCM